MPPSVAGMLILKTPRHTHSERGRGRTGDPADPGCLHNGTPPDLANRSLLARN